MQIRAMGSVCYRCNGQIHTDYRNSVAKKGWHCHSLNEREHERARESPREPDPCLDRLLLLFWAHYIEVLIYYAQVHCR